MTKKRAIFEEVSGSKQEKTVSAVGVIERNSQENNRGAIQIWLKILFTLVVVMILVGGLTRLTDSGLSITCLLYTSPSPRDRSVTRMPSSA